MLVFFLGKTSTIHVELLFRTVPGKSSWTGLSFGLVCRGDSWRNVHQVVSFFPTIGFHIVDENWTQTFFLKLSGRFWDIPAKSRDIPPKKFDFLGFEGHTELFGPHPFTWKTPTPPENIRTQKFRFGFFFRAWSYALSEESRTAYRQTCGHFRRSIFKRRPGIEIRNLMEEGCFYRISLPLKPIALWGGSHEVQSAPAELPNKDFQTKVGKKLPKQFPEPLSVGKLDVSDFSILKYLAWYPCKASRWKKKIVQILGGEKTFKICWKSAGEIFLSGLRGAQTFSNAFRIVFRIFFSRFSSRFSYRFKSFWGAVSFCRHAALTNSVMQK